MLANSSSTPPPSRLAWPCSISAGESTAACCPPSARQECQAMSNAMRTRHAPVARTVKSFRVQGAGSVPIPSRPDMDSNLQEFFGFLNPFSNPSSCCRAVSCSLSDMHVILETGPSQGSGLRARRAHMIPGDGHIQGPFDLGIDDLYPRTSSQGRV